MKTKNKYEVILHRTVKDAEATFKDRIGKSFDAPGPAKTRAERIWEASKTMRFSFTSKSAARAFGNKSKKAPNVAAVEFVGL